MQSRVRDEYLETEVMTATPQKLHSMLLDAAVRHCESARQLWDDRCDEQATAERVFEPLSKAQDIMAELLASLNFAENPELVRRIAGIYNFIFRAILTAQVRHDRASLSDALRLLGIERETWRQIVAKTASVRSDAASITHPKHSISGPVVFESAPATRFSIDA